MPLFHSLTALRAPGNRVARRLRHSSVPLTPAGSCRCRSAPLAAYLPMPSPRLTTVPHGAPLAPIAPSTGHQSDPCYVGPAEPHAELHAARTSDHFDAHVKTDIETTTPLAVLHVCVPPHGDSSCGGSRCAATSDRRQAAGCYPVFVLEILCTWPEARRT